MFANDCNIVVEGSSSVDVQTKLDSVAESCLAWASTNCLILNNAKTKTMLIRPSKRICFDDSFVVHMAGNPLVNVASAKILGIFLCSDIGNVNLTVDNTCKKIDTALFFIHNASKFVNSRVVSLLCIAFVKPHIYYCCEVWGPLCNVYQKAQIDKRIKICRRLCPNLDWLSFYFTVCYRVSFFMFKCIHSRSPIYI